MSDQLIVFTDQLHALLKAGIPLSQALGMIHSSETDQALEDAIPLIRSSVARGAALSAAIQESSRIFPAYYVESIRAAEIGGILPETLGRLSEYLKAEKLLRYKIHSYFKYPRFVAGFMIAAAVFLSWLQGILIFGKLQIALFVVAALVVLIIRQEFRAYRYTDKGMLRRDSLKLRVWPVNRIHRKQLQKVFAHMFLSIYKTGIPVVQLFHLTGNAMPNRVFGREISKIGDLVDGGTPLMEAVDSCPVLPYTLKQILRVGHEVGTLDKDFEDFVRKTELEISLMINRFLVNTYTIVLFILITIAALWLNREMQLF